MDSQTLMLVFLFGLVLGIVMMFAQVRLFSIDRTLKEIRAELTASNKKADRTTATQLNPLSIR